MVKRGSFKLSNGVYFKSGYTIVGKKEDDGNFGGNFDLVLKNDLWGEKSFEKAECKMHREAICGAIKKANLTPKDIDKRCNELLYYYKTIGADETNHQLKHSQRQR